MTISGRQKNRLEYQMRRFLWDFAKKVGLSDLYEIKQIIGKHMEENIQGIIFEMQQIPDNNGRLGNLRGWIKKRRKTVANYPDTFKELELDLLAEFKSQTKLLMNGDNILLGHKRCDYRDPEEQYYCGDKINYGFKYCRDHQMIIDTAKYEKEIRE